MEISGIDKTQTVKKLEVKQHIQAVAIEDRISISTEAQKRAEWVEMLKQMPDVRPEKIATISTTPNQNTFKIVAQRLVQS